MRLATLLLVTALTWPQASKAQFGAPNLGAVQDIYTLSGIRLNYYQLRQYNYNQFSHAIALRTNYADAGILNADNWDSTRAERVVQRVDLVYTHYPKDTTLWRTPFTQLMNGRIANLLELDEQFRNPAIQWNLVAQTTPLTEEQAIGMFHGFIVYYTVKLDRVDNPSPDAIQDRNWEEVKRIIGGEAIQDSTVITVFERHPEWKNILAVVDWTGSMYPYGAQLVTWYRNNAERDALKQLVFFNDGDDFAINEPFRYKPLGRTGGFYSANPRDLEDILFALETAMMNGDGQEPPENDMEAVLYARRKYPHFGELVLIADNNSSVRDIELLSRLDVPIRVVLCGTYTSKGGGALIQKDYLLMAWKTGGSVHTVTDDLVFDSKEQALENNRITIQGQRFVFTDGQFVFDIIDG